jgi:hypothetical protein
LAHLPQGRTSQYGVVGEENGRENSAGRGSFRQNATATHAPGPLGNARQIRKSCAFQRLLDLHSQALPVGMQWARILIVALCQPQNTPAHMIVLARSQNFAHVNRFGRPR